ncbi:hypothetical protein GJ496_006453, partial [Pomphorhynchus laevis]
MLPYEHLLQASKIAVSMRCHEVIPGAINFGLYQYSIGSVHDDHFIAYASNTNLIILDTNFKRIQTLPQPDNKPLSCVSCTREAGLIGASTVYSIHLYSPYRTFIRPGSLSQSTCNEWELTYTITHTDIIKIFSFSPDGENILIALENSFLELWTKVSQNVETIAIFTIGEQDHQNDSNTNSSEISFKWEKSWNKKLPSPVQFMNFSPNCKYFATAGVNDCIVRIWHRLEEVALKSVFLSHNIPIIYLRWRCNSRFLYGSDAISNCLLTVTKDGVCRIWSDQRLHIEQEEPAFWSTNKYKHRHKKISDTGLLKNALEVRKERLKASKKKNSISLAYRHFEKKSHSKFRRNLLSKLHISSNSVLHRQHSVDSSDVTQNLNSWHHFKSDENKLHALSKKGSRIFLQPIEVHSFYHTDNKFKLQLDYTASDWRLVAVINALSAMPECKNVQVCLHWLNNKEYNFTLKSEQLILNIIRDFNMKNSQPNCKRRTSSFSENDDRKEILQHSTSATSFFRSMSANELLRMIDRIPDIKFDNWKYYESKFVQMSSDVCQQPDFLFAFNPLDGTFLLWMVELLDDPKRSSIMCRSSLLSKIPFVMNAIESGTLTRSVRLFYDLDFVVPKISAKFNQCVDFEISMPTGLRIVTKHSNGILNLWEVQFADKGGNSSVAGISKIQKLCGHRYHLKEIRSHPLLPLVLTTSCNDFEGGLIVWKVDPCSPLLTSNGGIKSIDKVYCSTKDIYSLVTWFDVIRPRSKPDSQPGGLFAAFTGQQFGIFHISLCDLYKEKYKEGIHPSRILQIGTVSDSNKCWSNAQYSYLLPYSSILNLTDSKPEKLIHKNIWYMIVIDYSNCRIVTYTWKITIMNYDNPLSLLDDVVIESVKLDPYTLPISLESKRLVSITVASNFLNSAFLSALQMPSPVHCVSAFTDGSVWLWQCCLISDSRMEWRSCSPNTGQCDIQVNGIPLALKCAYSGRIAIMYISSSNATDLNTSADIIVDIVESESTAGVHWSLEDRLTVPKISIPDKYQNLAHSILSYHWKSDCDGQYSEWPQYKPKHVLRYGSCTDDIQIYKHLAVDARIKNQNNKVDVMKKLVLIDWGPSGDGSHILTIAVGQHIYFFGPNRTSIGHDLFQWSLLKHTLVETHDGLYPLPVQLKWIRSGLLLLGLQTEIQVFSPWTIGERSVAALKKFRCLLSNSSRLLTQNEINPKEFGVDNLWSSMRCMSNAIFDQYQPKVLIALISTGQIKQTFRILDHLKKCLKRNSNDVVLTPVPLINFVDDHFGQTTLDTIKTESSLDWLSMPVSMTMENLDDKPISKNLESQLLCDESLHELLSILQSHSQLDDQNSLDIPKLCRVIQAMLFVNSVKSKEYTDNFAERFLFFFAYHIDNHEKAEWQVSNRVIAWAHFCQSQDLLISSIFENRKVTWDFLKRFRVVLWIKDNNLLKTYIEKAAKSIFDSTDNPLDASLFYVLTGKIKLVSSLFKLKNNQKMYNFFASYANENCDQDATNLIAFKNASLLLRNHRYIPSICLFILAKRIDIAVEVCLNRLNDKDMALLIFRLIMSFNELHDFVVANYLRDCRDPFSRSVVFSMLNQPQHAIYELKHPAPGYIDESSVSLYLALSKASVVDVDLSEPLYKLAYKHLCAGSVFLALNTLFLTLDLHKKTVFQYIIYYRVVLKALTVEMQLLSVNVDFSGICMRQHFLQWFKEAVTSLKMLCSYPGKTPDATDNSNLWLKDNELLLRSLLSFCMIHSSEAEIDTGLNTVKLEILYLLSELWIPDEYDSLLFMLPPLIRLPLLCCVIPKESTLPVQPFHVNQISVFCELTRCSKSILITIASTKTLPSLYSSFAYRVSSLWSEAISLSDSTFQSLLIPKRVNIDRHSLLRSERGRQFTFHIESSFDDESGNCTDEDDETAQPYKWPGIQFRLRGISNVEIDDNVPNNLRLLLLEVLVACFVSLASCSLTLLDARHLKSLISVKWDDKMWNDLFGYGKTTSNKDINVGELTISGKFVEPSHRMISYFLKSANVNIDEHFDLPEPHTQDSSVTNCCYQGTDPRSYCWCLMRLAILTLARQNIANIMQILGIEPC